MTALRLLSIQALCVRGPKVRLQHALQQGMLRSCAMPHKCYFSRQHAPSPAEDNALVCGTFLENAHPEAACLLCKHLHLHGKNRQELLHAGWQGHLLTSHHDPATLFRGLQQQGGGIEQG